MLQFNFTRIKFSGIHLQAKKTGTLLKLPYLLISTIYLKPLAFVLTEILKHAKKETGYFDQCPRSSRG
jgi:hypothetical protein